MRKSIPYGLLAFAVSTSLLVAQEGWSAKAGSGLTYNGGDSFGVNWLNFVQVGWSFANNENAADTNSFDVGTARTQLRGHAFNKNITYRLQLDLAEGGGTLGEDADGDPVLANDSILKDAYAQYNFSTSDDGRVGVRLGQGKTMFGLESTGWVHGLWFVDRSGASQAFSAARSRGAWLVGSVMEKDKPIRFAIGAMNTDASPVVAGLFSGGEEGSNPDNELSYVAAVNWDILGDFFGGEQTAEYWRQGDFRSGETDLKGTIGAGVALGNSNVPGVSPGLNGPDLESTTFNLNTAWTVNSINLMGEFFTRTDEVDGGGETEPMGWAVSGGYLLPKSGDSSIQWGLGLRVNMVEGDNSDLLFAGEEVMEVSGVVNAFYHGHACKTQLQYTYQDLDQADQTNHILSVLFQLTF
jgi:hypothetical protein